MDDLIHLLNLGFLAKYFLMGVLFYLPLERLFPIHLGQKIFRKGWGSDLTCLFINSVMIRAGLTAILVGAVFLGNQWLPGSLHESIAGQPEWLQFLEILLIGDLGFYATHRLLHSIPSLWRFHRIHHSIEELDWLAGVRVHVFEQIFVHSTSYVPIMILGFSPIAFAAYVILYNWHTAFIHCNLRIGLGPLTLLFATPRFHHWHHSSALEDYDKNFAAQLSFIDALFGTLHLPKGRRPVSYGINEKVPENYFKQLIYPFAPARPRTPLVQLATNDKN